MGCAECMEVDDMVFIDGLIRLAILWRCIPAVVKPAGICRPRSTRKLGPLDKVRCIVASFHIADMPGLPIRAYALNRIRKPGPAGRHTCSRERSRAICRQQVRIEQDATIYGRSIPDHQLCLVRKAWIVCPEPLPAILPRHTYAFIIPEVSKTFPERLPPGKRTKIRHRYFVLRFDPGGCFIGIGIFKPAIWISDIGAMDDIHDVFAAGYRILHWPCYS